MALSSIENKFTKIGVFYDGNFFALASNYYRYDHERNKRISLSGLHEFIISKVSEAEDASSRHCHVTEAHFFRGRLSAYDAQARDPDKLYGERMFDEKLMRAGVSTHFLPLVAGGEKGIDVWLALETFELVIRKRIDVVVLITGDSDFIPLIRKIRSAGARVMVIGWNFIFNDRGNEKSQRTSNALLKEANYSFLMNEIIAENEKPDLVNKLFEGASSEEPGSEGISSEGISSEGISSELSSEEFSPEEPGSEEPGSEGISSEEPSSGELSSKAGIELGTITNLTDKGFGFIKPNKSESDVNLYFHSTGLSNINFDKLELGMDVSYELGTNKKGPCAVNIKAIDKIV